MPRHLKYLNDVTTYSPRDIIYIYRYIQQQQQKILIMK